MIQTFRLGYHHSSVLSFAVNSRTQKFCCLFSVNLRIGSKRLCSKSLTSAEPSLSEESITGMPKPRKNASKASVGKSGSRVDECEDIDNMTIQQIKSLRSVEVPATGAMRELPSGSKFQRHDEGSLASEDQKSDVIKANSKRTAKRLFERNQVSIKNNDSATQAVKRTKRREKQAVDAIELKSIQSKNKQELITKSTELEGEKAVQAKRKVSRITTPNIKIPANVDVSVKEPWTVLIHKKPQQGWIAYNPKTMRPPPIGAGTSHMKLMSWNVNGLRALLKSESLSALQLAQRENFDVLCLQETKLQEKDVHAIGEGLLEGYDNSYWTCSVSKLGYSGTAIISRIKPVSVRYGLGISDHDAEGRLMTVEFDNFYLLNGYVPNSGDGLKRLSYRITHWDPSLSDYMKDLERSKPVILTGDLNCAHQEIDIWNPAGNKRSAGFTDEERQSFQTNFLDKGFVDTFRKQHPDAVGYTYWGYRHGGRKTNKGWRLDYFLASESISSQVYDSYILPDVTGSDHSPIGLVLKL